MTATICRLCAFAYPTLMDDFKEHGCDGEYGVHTPEAVVLATVLAAAVNGAGTTDLHAQAFLDDALHLMDVLGPAPSWSVVQDRDDIDRWTVNGVHFVLDFGGTGEGPGTLLPMVPDRTCPACEESVGWQFMDDRHGRIEIECKGCGQDLVIERWWQRASAVKAEL